LDLFIDRKGGVITVAGTRVMCSSCLEIVQLLDSKDSAEFVPVQRANIASVKQAAQVLNVQTQRAAVNPKVAQNQPNPAAQLPAPNETAGGAVVGPVQIDIIDGLDTMVIRGNPKDVAAIQAMIKQLESMSLEHEPLIQLVELKHADAYRVGTMVQQLYSQVYLARRGSLTMIPLVKPNTILLIGKQESLDTAKELIAKLDRPVDPDTQFKIFRLKNASSDTLTTTITNFYNNTTRQNQGLEPKVFVVSDYRTNSLIVQASPRDLAEITAMVTKLDTAGSDALNVVKTFPLKNAMASELATTLQNAIRGTGTTGTGGFGGGGASSSSGTRGHDLALSTIDAQGNQLRANVLYDVSITADTRSNTLIVSAPADCMPLIEAIIKELDKLPTAEAQIKVFTLVNGDASTLTTTLTNLFAQTASTGGGFGGGAQSASQIATVRPGIEEGESTLVSVRFQADTRTNSIIACGSAGDMAVVEALLIRLDEDNMNNRKVMVMKLINTKADDIATTVQNYVQQERQLEIQNSATYYPQSPAEQYRKEVIVVPEIISNSLIISTTPQFYEQIKNIVKELDERQLMVGIQVLIAEVRLTGNREEGIEIGLQDSLLFDRSVLSNGTPVPGFLFGDPTQGLPLGNVNSGNVGTQGITSLGTGRISSRSGVGGFTFAASSESVSVLVRALEEHGKLRVLSRPHLTTMHNNRATVKVGQDVPYVSAVDSGSYSGNTNSQVQYREVGTILDVTPRITPDGRIVMSVYVEKSRVGANSDGVPISVSGGQVINSPKIDITNAQTVVSANDNETIVFAGLITEEKESVERSVPYLNKIPVVKNFFQYKSNYCTRSELLIVLTPTIIRNETDEAIIRQQEASRMHWCISDVVRMTGNSKMQIRGDYVDTQGVPMIHAGEVIVDEKLLPKDEKVRPLLPVPTLAPETK
jgi:type II secretory pathway component GspD/PulD (secretin)